MTQKRPFLVEISGNAGLRTAPDVLRQLHDALATHDMVSVATHAIAVADITTIQLLLSARRQAQASRKSLSLAAPAKGVLGDLLIATGCLSVDGQPLTPDGDFWTSQTGQDEGIPA
jgi:ABC-type transporter Mla MlaB component